MQWVLMLTLQPGPEFIVELDPFAVRIAGQNDKPHG
jgi:hypothetical protein